MRKLYWTGETKQCEGQTFLFPVPAERGASSRSLGGWEQWDEEPTAVYINGLPVEFIRQTSGFDPRTQSVLCLFQFVPEEDHVGGRTCQSRFVKSR